MKLKIKLVALVLILVVATALVLCACKSDDGLFRKNQERVGKQITADAVYADRVGIVTLNDLYNSYYNYYSYLYTYYQYGYIDAATFQSYLDNLDKTFSTYNENLAKDALFSLKCIEYLSDYFKTACPDQAKVAKMQEKSTVGITYDFSNVDALAKYYKDRADELKAIYSCYDNYLYVNKAIKYANDAMQNLYDNYVEEVRAEYEAASGTIENDTTPSGYVGIELTQTPYRLVYEKGDSELNTTGLVVKALYSEGDPVVIPVKYLTISGFDASSVSASVEISVKYGKYTQTFNVAVVDALPTKGDVTSDEEDEDAELAELTNDNTEELKYFSFAVLESNYVKDGQSEAAHKAAIKEYKIANTAMNRVLKYLEENYRSYNYYLYLGYLSQLTDITEEIMNVNTTVSLSDVQAEYDKKVAEEIEGYYSTPYSKDSISSDTIVHKNYEHAVGDNKGYYYVTQILIGFDNDTLKKAVEFDNEKVSSEDSFKEYLYDLLPEVTAYTYNPDYDASAECELEECECPRCKNYNGEVAYEFDTIEKWYGLYEGNDFIDPCKNNHTGEVTCPCVACPTKKYSGKVNAMEYIQNVSDALDACTTMPEKVAVFNDFVNEINMDSGIFSNIKDGKIGYVMTPDGVPSGMIEEFETKCDELAANGVGSYGYTIGEYETDKYGIHFIMVTEYVVDDANGTVTPITVKSENDYVKLGLDYVTDLYAEGDDIAVKNAEGAFIYYKPGTIGYAIATKVEANAKSVKVAEFRKDFLSNNSDKINYYPKAYKSTVKDLQDQTSGK